MVHGTLCYGMITRMVSHTLDVYRRTGDSRKESLPLSFAEALTLAETDIEEKWEQYRDRFVEGAWP